MSAVDNLKRSVGNEVEMISLGKTSLSFAEDNFETFRLPQKIIMMLLSAFLFVPFRIIDISLVPFFTCQERCGIS